MVKTHRNFAEMMKNKERGGLERRETRRTVMIDIDKTDKGQWSGKRCVKIGERRTNDGRRMREIRRKWWRTEGAQGNARLSLSFSRWISFRIAQDWGSRYWQREDRYGIGLEIVVRQWLYEWVDRLTRIKINLKIGDAFVSSSNLYVKSTSTQIRTIQECLLSKLRYEKAKSRRQ